jgi:hypothetical protein
MSGKAASNRDRLRTFVIGLTVACPYDQGNPDECPLCSLRKKPIADRVRWVNSLSEAELSAIAESHADCLTAKEAQDIPPPAE